MALRAVESARQAAEGGAAGDRAAHVGYHLIGKGRRDLETDLAYRPAPLAAGCGASASPTPPRVYLGSIALVTAALRRASASPTSARCTALALDAGGRRRCSCCCRPATPPSPSSSAWPPGWSPPRRLPRLEFAAGIPESARTMVVVPTLLTSVPAVEELLEHIEVLALGNLDPYIHFAILSDFADAARARHARTTRRSSPPPAPASRP